MPSLPVYVTVREKLLCTTTAGIYEYLLVFFMSMSGWCLDKEGGKSLLIVELFQF